MKDKNETEQEFDTIPTMSFMEEVEMLRKKYPNDSEFGKAVSNLIK